MNKALTNFLCWFIPFSQKREEFRKAHIKNSHTEGMPSPAVPVSNSPVEDVWEKISKDNHIEINEEDKKNFVMNINGKNNNIIIKKLAKNCTAKITIDIFGDNNTINIDTNVWVTHALKISIGRDHKLFGPVFNTYIQIGACSKFGQVNIISRHSHTSTTIGKNCMFAWGINVFNTDFHPIYDIETKKIVNKVKDLHIGDHCWICANATILKNVFIPDDCIIGFGSVVSSGSVKNMSPHSIAAGNPAKVVKSGVTWDSNGSKGYVQNELVEDKDGK